MVPAASRPWLTAAARRPSSAKLTAGTAEPIPSAASAGALAPVTKVRGVLKKCAVVLCASAARPRRTLALTIHAGGGSGWVPSPAWACAAKSENSSWPGPPPGTPHANAA